MGKEISNRLCLKIEYTKQRLIDISEELEEIHKAFKYQELELNRLQTERVSHLHKLTRSKGSSNIKNSTAIQQRIMQRMIFLNKRSSDENEIRLEELAKLLDWIEGNNDR